MDVMTRQYGGSTARYGDVSRSTVSINRKGGLHEN